MDPVNEHSSELSSGSPSLPDAAASRRRFLAGFALLAGGVVLAGCQQQKDFIPGPVYPDVDDQAGESPVTFVPPVQRGPNGKPVAPWTPPKDNPLPSGVLPRSSWTRATPVTSLADPMNGVSRITIHHDAISSVGLNSQSEVAMRLETIRSGHRAHNWADIGYHYIVDPSGRIWEGRPLWLQGAHVKDTNEHNIGVMCMGNFQVHQPTTSQLNSLDNFVAQLCRTHRIPVGRVYTHRELKPTLCPGQNLQRYMAMTRSSGGRMMRLA